MDEALGGGRLLDLVAHLPDIVVAEVEADGTILVASRPGPPPLDYAAGASLFETVSEAYRPALRVALGSVLAGGSAATIEAVVTLADGTCRHVSLRLGPLPPRDGVRSVVVVCRQLAERAEPDPADAASDGLESVGALAAGIAHEINNPLAAVIANLDLALREAAGLATRVDLPAEFLDELKDAREGAERVRVIMRDLRMFAAPGSDRLAAVDVRRLLDSALRMAWNEVRHRARVVKLYGQVPLVEASEPRLGRAFFNLVLHIARGLPVGQADRHDLRVITGQDDGDVFVTIAVCTAGATEIVTSPFAPLSDGSAARRAPGVAAAARVVEGLHGVVEVAGSPAGTAMRLRLRPVRHEAPSEVRRDPARAARRGRVLLIDDEPMMGVVVRRTLGAEHDVIALTNAAAALSLLGAGEDFDVILCDVMMPQMTGVEFYEALGARLPHLVQRVVFLTGGTFTDSAREFLEACPNLRLEKPFEHLKLRALVNERIG